MKSNSERDQGSSWIVAPVEEEEGKGKEKKNIMSNPNRINRLISGKKKGSNSMTEK
jgi:hypothetical protein